jgi:phasin family protein
MEAKMADKPIVKTVASKKPLSTKPVTTTGAKTVALKKTIPMPIAAKPAPAKPSIAAEPIIKPPAAKPAVEKTVARVIPKPAIAPKLVPVTETPIKIAAPVPTPPINEGKPNVTETFTKIENNAQNFTADATNRVKSAMEKGTKGVEELVEFSKGNLEAVVASGKLAAKGAEEIAKYATDYGRTTIEKANATAKQFAAVKSPTEFFQLQSELAKSSLDSFVGEASKFGENYFKLLGEIAQPIQNRYALAVEKVKTAVAV